MKPSPEAMPRTEGDLAIRPEDVGEVELDGFLELFVGAGLGIAVGAPSDELRRVTEADAFHVVVADLDDALRA